MAIEQPVLFRLTDRRHLSGSAYILLSAVSSLTAPLVAIGYAGGRILRKAHSVTIPWRPGARPRRAVGPDSRDGMATEVDQILRALDDHPSLAGYIQAARLLSGHRSQLKPVRIAVLASFTLDAAVPILIVEAARLGFAAEVYVAPFNSVKQELLNPESGCCRHRPDVVFVANLLGDICPELADDLLSLSAPQVERAVQALATDLAAAVTEFRKHSPAAVVVHNLARPRSPLLGVYEPMAPVSPTGAIQQLNARLATRLAELPAAYTLDFDRVCADVGYANAFDDKLWYLGRAPLAAPALRALAETQAVFVRAIMEAPRKCLVLDLDNVLWGGVIGESRLADLQLGQTYPGNVFREFQRAVLELSRSGVLLAINSKNNPEEVAEVFRAHPDMVLKLDHFACTRINWQDKPTNMREIAAELNIGLDSLVFFDDCPAEQARMRQALPQVLTLAVPPEPIGYLKLLRECRAFDRLSLTAEDRRRGEMYRDQAARRQVQQSAGSVEEFLASLEMKVSIGPLDEFAFPRVVDLLQKTNQFNLTTRRHSAGELAALMADPACGAFWLRVQDRFGDNGIVGVALVQRREATAHIDSFLLSCRVIGRTVETALLSHVADWARRGGASLLEGEFIPTPKNSPAADFYERHGFTRVASTAVGSRWRLDLSTVPFAWPAYIRRNGTA
jgi:FkbH-like protein